MGPHPGRASNLVPERALRRPLPFMVEEETGTLATTTAKTALNIKKAFFQVLLHLFRHTSSLKCR